MKEIYDSEITNPSLEELEKIVAWYNEKIGHYPTIVGGWAVYAYTQGLGSKDIDIIFPSAEAMHGTLLDFFKAHGYKQRPRTFFYREFYKEIIVNGKNIEIIIDAAAGNRKVTIEGKNVVIPWNWALKNNQLYTKGNLKFYIPIIELLLTYKLAAILGRYQRWKLGKNKKHYTTKIWKDIFDVMGLALLEFDIQKLEKFFEDCRLVEYKQEIWEIIEVFYDEELQNNTNRQGWRNIKQILTGSGNDPATSNTKGAYN